MKVIREGESLNFSRFTFHMGYITSDLGRFEKKTPADAVHVFFSV